MLGGTFLKHRDKYSSIILTLTDGTLSSPNNIVESRRKEVELLDKEMNIKRISLGIQDGMISYCDESIKKIIIKELRRLKPSIIISPYYLESHPDHKYTYFLIKECVYKSAIKIYPELGMPYAIPKILCYSQKYIGSNSFFVDVSDFYREKQRLIKYYASQFSYNNIEKTYLNQFLLKQIISKDCYCGNLSGVKFAEELIYEQPIITQNIFKVLN